MNIRIFITKNKPKTPFLQEKTHIFHFLGTLWMRKFDIFTLMRPLAHGKYFKTYLFTNILKTNHLEGKKDQKIRFFCRNLHILNFPGLPVDILKNI